MRDYSQIDMYLDKLQSDIYAQPEDAGHTDAANAAIDWLQRTILDTFKIHLITSVLDVGCGQGFCRDIFLNKAIYWHGVTLSPEDYDVCKSKYYNVDFADISFLPYVNEHFGCVFARHILEHSPMPLLTLMEWYRVSDRFAFIVLPAPEYWTVCGRNHYYVLPKQNWECLFTTANWKVLKSFDMKMSHPAFYNHWLPDKDRAFKDADLEEHGDKIVEYWFLLEKIWDEKFLF